jgi:hypothetical protein
LLTIASGHPSGNVQVLAKRLEAELSAAVTHTRHAVNDLLRGRDYQEQLKYAQQCHEKALKTTQDLDNAIKEAGHGVRHRRALPATGGAGD